MAEHYSFIRNYDEPYKIQITLPRYLWSTINQDIRDFYLTDKDCQRKLTDFINTIFYNFHENAQASIDEVAIQIDNEYTNFLKSEHLKDTAVQKLAKKYATSDEEGKELLRDLRALCKHEVKHYTTWNLTHKIINFKKAYPDSERETSQKIIMSTINRSILEEAATADYYEGDVNLYLSNLFAEYASKPNFEREEIFFKERIDAFMGALKLHHKLRIRLKPVTDKEETTKKKAPFYLLTPYKVVHDDKLQHAYFIGIAERDSNEGRGSKSLACFRLSHMYSPDVWPEEGVLTPEEQNYIEEKIKIRGIAYISRPAKKFTIKFTEVGLDKFNHSVNNRPSHYNIIDKDQNIYEFICTPFHAEIYFFAFGPEIEILKEELCDNEEYNDETQPHTLKEKLLSHSLKTLQVYDSHKE